MAQSHTEALPNHLLHFKFSCCLLPNFLLVFVNPGSQGSGTGMQLLAGICHSSLVAFCGLSPSGTFGHAGGQHSTDRQHLIICRGFGAPVGTFGATAAGDEHHGELRTSCRAKSGCESTRNLREFQSSSHWDNICTDLWPLCCWTILSSQFFLPDSWSNRKRASNTCILRQS